MKRTVIFGAVLCTALSIGLVASALSPIPAAAYADDTAPQTAASSSWTRVSNLEWKLDSAGTVVLRPLGGQGSANVNDSFSLNVSEIAPNVKNFRVEGSIEFSGPISFNSMFCGCSALETVDLSGITVANSADTAQMFENCPSLTSVKLPKQLAPTSAKFMFYNCKKLQAIDLSGCDFRSLKTADYMFGNCSALTAVAMPASEKATFSNLETMNGMFTGCSSLQTLDLTSSALPNVREAEYAFSGCTNLRTATITGLNGSNIAMEGLFDGCTALASITFKKPAGTTADIRPSTMSYVFRNCSSLQSLDLNSFDTRSATSMSKLFNGCSKLIKVMLGANFRFEGCGQNRLCSLPTPADTATFTGKWVSSVDGNAYTAESAPTTEGKVVTWTAQKVADAPQDPIFTFIDVLPSTPHAKDIQWLANCEISTGWVEPSGTKSFRPYTAVLRADMAAFLYRLAGSPAYALPATSPFIDVNSSTPHYKEICWLANSGISKGWSIGNGKTEFRPYTAITRADMAAFLYRLAGHPSYSNTDKPFSDCNNGTAHYKSICWLATTGITEGWTELDGGKTFRPYSNITRADMAAFLHRMKDQALV